MNIPAWTEQARDYRDQAARARRFVLVLGCDTDGMYLRFAKEREQRAAQLEALMKRSAPLAIKPPPDRFSTVSQDAGQQEPR